MTDHIQNRELTLTEAQVLKELALADKFQAEAEDFRKAQALKAAETLKELAEARNAEYAAELTRISRDQALRQENIIMAANHHHHVYEFNTAVNGDSVDGCLAQLAIWHRQDPTCPWEIIMNSPGGSVIDGMNLFDEIMGYSKRPWDTSDRPKGGHSTRMVVRGYAASMAGILLQAVDERVMGAEASLLVHEVATFASGKIGEIRDEVKWLSRMSERVADIFVARSSGKTSLEKFTAGWTRTDWWLDSDAALKHGFIDKIA